MHALNHLVLAGHDLDALRTTYAALGFTLTAAGQHPFGTGNTVIQLQGCYLELLAVTRPADVVEHVGNQFSFSAFNRDYLARHEGFSMLVLDTPDAEATRAEWQAAGLRVHDCLRFSRQARLPGGETITVGFVLAMLSNPKAPWLGHFACQHFQPGYYQQPEFLRHANDARRVADVWISGPGALELSDHFARTLGTDARAEGQDRIVLPTASGDVVLASADAFTDAFGVEPPHPGDGPHLAGLTIACGSLAHIETLGLRAVGPRRVLGPDRAFGLALAFQAAG